MTILAKSGKRENARTTGALPRSASTANKHEAWQVKFALPPVINANRISNFHRHRA